MTDSYLGTPPAIPDELPPSYEQALDHRRLETSDVPPGYSPREATGHSRLVHASNVNTNRTYQLPRIDLTRGRSPERSLASTTRCQQRSLVRNKMSNCLKLALPPMHMCIAITCLVINILLPGLGTILAGFGIFCCTNPNAWPAKEKFQGCGICLLVGILQLILVPVILVGWIWSVVWGLALLGVSLDEYHGMKDNDEDEEADTRIRPQSGLFGRITRPSTTRRAIRQSTSRVSPGLPTYNARRTPPPPPSGSEMPDIEG